MIQFHRVFLLICDLKDKQQQHEKHKKTHKFCVTRSLHVFQQSKIFYRYLKAKFQVWWNVVFLPSNSSLMSFAACNPSSFKFLSIKRLRAAAARSSADCAQPMIRIASEQNVLTTFFFLLLSFYKFLHLSLSSLHFLMLSGLTQKCGHTQGIYLDCLCRFN